MATRRNTARSGSRRKMVWARSLITGIGVPVGAAVPFKFNLLGGFETDYGANLIGATVTRIRGVIATVPSASPVPASGQLVVGARIGNDNEVISGNGPIAQPYLDWMMWEPFCFSNGAAVDTDGASASLNRVIDVKSQRKLEEINEEAQIWLEAAGVDFAVTFNLSILLKLP